MTPTVQNINVPAATEMLPGEPVPKTEKLFLVQRRATPDTFFRLDWVLLHAPTGVILSQHHTRRAAVDLGRDLCGKLGVAHWRGDNWIKSPTLNIVLAYIKRRLIQERSQNKVWK